MEPPRNSSQPAIVFEASEGMMWLRGRDLDLAAPILGLRYEGKAVGFDSDVAMAYVQALLTRKVLVSVRKGATLRVLTLRRHTTPLVPPSTPIRISVGSLFDPRELQQLAKRMSRKHPVFATDAADADGRVYVYRVEPDWYEVDWELTSVSRKAVEAMALAAHLAGEPLLCHLVVPKPRRGRAPTARPISVEVTETLTLGQLRLAF